MNDEQRLVQLGEVGRLGRPVVHLGVDVDRVVRAPRRPQLVVPDALQVRRLRARAAAGDQQVAAVLEQQLDELRIRGAELHDPLIGRQRRRRRAGRRHGAAGGRERQRHAIEQAAVIGDVLARSRSSQRPAPAQRRRSADASAAGSRPSRRRGSVEAVEAGRARHQERDRVGVLDRQASWSRVDRVRPRRRRRPGSRSACRRRGVADGIVLREVARIDVRRARGRAGPASSPSAPIS